MTIHTLSLRYRAVQRGPKLWLIFDADRVIAEAFTESDARVIVAALDLSCVVQSRL